MTTAHRPPRRHALGFTLTEVAERFGCSRRTIVRWVKQGRLQAFRDGARWLIPAHTVEELDP